MVVGKSEKRTWCCFRGVHQKKNAEPFMTGSESRVLCDGVVLLLQRCHGAEWSPQEVPQERSRLDITPSVLNCFCCFTGLSSLILARGAGKGNDQAVKQAKHVGVVSQGHPSCCWGR